MSIKEDIKLIAATMEMGETIRQVCPSCWGGSSREKSLTITLFPNNIVKYNCFRNSCLDGKGSYARSGAEPLTDNIAKPIKQRRKKFNGAVVPLTDFERDWIKKVWGIDEAPHWYHTHQFGGRVAMSIRSPKYAHRGWVLRDIYGNSTTKALTYVEDGEVPLCWYRNHEWPGILLVEDIPSAVRASKYITAVALLGTGAGLDRAAEIASYGTGPILIALDQDATNDAFQMMQRWALMWDDVRVLPLTQDIKDMQEDKVEKLIVTARKI